MPSLGLTSALTITPPRTRSPGPVTTPWGVVTRTGCTPAATAAGVVALTVVSLTTATAVHAPPTSTAVEPVSVVPVMTMGVPVSSDRWPGRQRSLLERGTTTRSAARLDPVLREHASGVEGGKRHVERDHRSFWSCWSPVEFSEARGKIRRQWFSPSLTSMPMA